MVGYALSRLAALASLARLQATSGHRRGPVEP
jgi:hypothetical protein